jgi:TM2 domain-containing membrane protein YozV
MMFSQQKLPFLLHFYYFINFYPTFTQIIQYHSTIKPPDIMTNDKVDFYLMTNGKFFEASALPEIRNRLLSLDENKWSLLQLLQFKDPTTTIIISVLVGGLGIDRFYIGDTGLGVAKLLTCGGLGIWTIVDWFMIMDAAKRKNLETLTYNLMY